MSASDQVVQGLIGSGMPESKAGAEVEEMEADVEEAEADANSIPKFRICESAKDELWNEFALKVCVGVRGYNKDFTMDLSQIIFEAVIQQLESLPLVPLVQVTPRDFLNEIKKGILNGIEQYNEKFGEGLTENNLVKNRDFSLVHRLWDAKLHSWYCDYTCPLLVPTALLTTDAQKDERIAREFTTVAAIVQLRAEEELLQASVVSPESAQAESPSIQVPAPSRLESKADGIQNNQIQPQNNERHAKIVTIKAVLAHLRAQLQLMRARVVLPQSAPVGHRSSIQARAPSRWARGNGVQNNQMQALPRSEFKEVKDDRKDQQQNISQRPLHMPDFNIHRNRQLLNRAGIQPSLRDEGKRRTGKGPNGS